MDELNLDLSVLSSDTTIIVMSISLVLARLLTFLYLSPFFGSKSMGRTVRVGFVFALAIILTPKVFADFKAQEELADYFIALIFKEIIVGLVLGSLVWMPIRGLEFSGILLDTQRGSSMAQDFNVVFSSPQATPTAILLSQLFSGYFFTVGGLIIVISLLFESIAVWPQATILPEFDSEIALLYGQLAGSLLFTAVMFALPISGFMFLADIAIAFAAKSAPTLNALTLGMPVKTAIMILMLFAYVDVAFPGLVEGLFSSIDNLESVLAR